MPPKMLVGKSEMTCLNIQKMFTISGGGAKGCLHFTWTILPARPYLFEDVGNPCCLPTFLEAFPPPVRDKRERALARRRMS